MEYGHRDKKTGRVYCYFCGYNGFKPNKHIIKKAMTCYSCGTKNKCPFIDI